MKRNGYYLIYTMKKSDQEDNVTSYKKFMNETESFKMILVNLSLSM